MVYPLDTATEEDLESGLLANADLVDFYLKDEDGEPAFLRCWNWPGSRVYPANDPSEIDGAVGASNVTYESMFDRIAIPKGLRMSASLASEPLTISVDASRSGDDEDFMGRFLDRQWHQCRMRVRSVLMSRATGALREGPHDERHGLINTAQLRRKNGEPQAWDIECQGSLFRVRGRRMRTRTHEDQQKRSAGDLFYQGTPLMVGVPLLWNRAPASIPGVVSNGGVVGGGGGATFGNNKYGRENE